MVVNYKLSVSIIVAAILHILGFAAYIFDFIPIEFQKVYFYNLDRIYLIILLTIFYYLSINKIIKISIALSLSIQIISTLIINAKYFVNLNNNTSECIWIIFLALGMVISLIVFYYVSSRQISKR